MIHPCTVPWVHFRSVYDYKQFDEAVHMWGTYIRLYIGNYISGDGRTPLPVLADLCGLRLSLHLSLPILMWIDLLSCHHRFETGFFLLFFLGGVIEVCDPFQEPTVFCLMVPPTMLIAAHGPVTIISSACATPVTICLRLPVTTSSRVVCTPACVH